MHSGGFNKLRIVEQHQRLQRRGGGFAARGADLAGGRVKNEHAWAAARFVSKTCKGCGDTDLRLCPARNGFAVPDCSQSPSGW